MQSSRYYEGGVPYIMHKRDWFELVPRWISWVRFAFDRYDGIESDMYAFMLASYEVCVCVCEFDPSDGFQCVQLGLKHTLVESLMSTCMKSMDQDIHPFDDTNFFIHYCTSYKVDVSSLDKGWSDDGMLVFNKHWTKARTDRRTKQKQLWLIECASPLLIEVPKIVQFERYDARRDSVYRKAYKQYQVARRIGPMFNEALMAYKERHCENKSMINREKSIILHEATLDNGDILYHSVESV